MRFAVWTGPVSYLHGPGYQPSVHLVAATGRTYCGCVRLREGYVLLDSQPPGPVCRSCQRVKTANDKPTRYKPRPHTRCLSVECPDCESPVGHACLTSTGRPSEDPHGARLDVENALEADEARRAMSALY